MANSADPDQFASSEANWSGSTLFCKDRAYLGSAGQGLMYISHNVIKHVFGHVRLAKIQISLGICAVCSKSSLDTLLIAKEAKFLHADNEDSEKSVRMHGLISVFVGAYVRRYGFSRWDWSFEHGIITKTRLFKYIENFTTKNWKFLDKNSDIFPISVQNIDCGYSLEPPRRGGSNEYPQSMFLSRNKKNNIYPCKPQFSFIKVGFKGVTVMQILYVCLLCLCSFCF